MGKREVRKRSDAHADESEVHSVGVPLLAAVPVAVARRAVMARDAEHVVALGRDGTFDPVLAESWEVVDVRTWKRKLRQDPRTVLGVSDRGAPLVLEP